MPVPRITIQHYSSPEPFKKLHHIIGILCDMGYDVEFARDVVIVIENNNLDKSQFDFPYGSFEEFKKFVLDGKFDLDISKHVFTEAQRKERDLKVKKGLLWRRD